MYFLMNRRLAVNLMGCYWLRILKVEHLNGSFDAQSEWSTSELTGWRGFIAPVRVGIQ
jgi:hypothetical protein